jgi:3-oxoacyl-[acyl-carrier-protein] synthase-1
MSEPLAVTGLGAVTAVGYSAIASCAALRAGLSLATELDSFEVADPTTGAGSPVVGHCARGLTDGYVSAGRLIRLAVRALEDLRLDLASDDFDDTHVLLCLPSGWDRSERDRQRAEGLLEADDEAAGVSAHYPKPFDRVAELRDRGIRTALRMAGLPQTLSVRCFAADEAGFAEAASAAFELIQRGAAGRCIVGGVDCYVDVESLDVAHDLGLLKTDANPVGFMPGEAAAFVALESLRRTRRDRGAPHALLHAPAIAREPFHRCSGRPALGAALAGSILASLSGLPGRSPTPSFLVGSLNGDGYRAQDFGTALVRLGPTRDLGELPHWRPAASFGQIGAALGAASVAVCARAFSRGYAPGDVGLVWLTGDRGDRAAFAVTRAVS